LPEAPIENDSHRKAQKRGRKYHRMTNMDPDGQFSTFYRAHYSLILATVARRLRDGAGCYFRGVSGGLGSSRQRGRAHARLVVHSCAECRRKRISAQIPGRGPRGESREPGVPDSFVRERGSLRHTQGDDAVEGQRSRDSLYGVLGRPLWSRNSIHPGLQTHPRCGFVSIARATP